MAPRETENKAYAKCWSEQQRVLWYVMVFFGVINFKSVKVLVLFGWKHLRKVIY